MTAEKKAERPRYIFRVAMSGEGWDVTRRIAGSGHALVMISYEDKAEADNLVEQLNMLELRAFARKARARRKNALRS